MKCNKLAQKILLSNEDYIGKTKFIVVNITQYSLNNKMHWKRYHGKNKMHLKRFKPGCNIYGDPNEKG